jgi:hypothetical protein
MIQYQTPYSFMLPAAGETAASFRSLLARRFRSCSVLSSASN